MKVKKEFLLELLDIGEYLIDEGTDHCSVRVKRDGIVFTCELQFDIYQEKEKDGSNTVL